MSFIKLTRGDYKYFVNTQNIVIITQDEKSTVLMLNASEDLLRFDESVEEIIRMIKEGDTDAE